VRGSERIYDVRMAQFGLKIKKIVPYYRYARIPRLMVSVPDYGSCQFPIKQVSTVKSLGAHIDENLIWECHINELSKKIASGIRAIERIRYSVPYKTLLSIHNSLVQPHLNYCNSV